MRLLFKETLVIIEKTKKSCLLEKSYGTLYPCACRENRWGYCIF